VASIATIEQTQRGLPNEPGRPGRFAQSTGRSVNVQPLDPDPALGRDGETAGHPTVSRPPPRNDAFVPSSSGARPAPRARCSRAGQASPGSGTEGP
jgi:hypothetical protein